MALGLQIFKTTKDLLSADYSVHGIEFKTEKDLTPPNLKVQRIKLLFSSSPLSFTVELYRVYNRPYGRWLNTAILLVAPLAYARALSVDTLSLMVEHI